MSKGLIRIIVTRLGWTLTGPPGSIWELTITSLDLGSRQTNLNLSSTQYHQSQGDFLLVGPGGCEVAENFWVILIYKVKVMELMMPH